MFAEREEDYGANGTAPRSSTSEIWDEPVGLDETPESAPEFPVRCIPGVVGSYVEQLAEALEVPRDLAALTALSVVASTIAGKVRVRPRSEWSEPTNIYTAVALPPGERKSAVFTALVRPILDAENALADQVREQSKAIEARRAEVEEQLAKAKQSKKAAAAVDVEALRTELAALELPREPRLVADDVTPEKLVSLMAEQPGERILLASAEGGFLDSMLGLRYGDKGSANLEVFLKGHAGDLLRVDRQTRASVRLRRPALTIATTLQPDVLRDLAAKPGVRTRGGLARFLLAIPRPRVGTRKGEATPPDPLVRDGYHAKVRALVDLPVPAAGEKTPRMLLSTEAYQVFRAFERETEPRLGEGGDLQPIADWGGKLCGAVARIAAILHCIDADGLPWEEGRTISASTMRAAVAIGRHLTAHALVAFGAMTEARETDAARLVLRHLQRHCPATITPRDLQRSHSRRFPKQADALEALQFLEERGFLRFARRTARGGNVFDVHPALRK